MSDAGPRRGTVVQRVIPRGARSGSRRVNPMLYLFPLPALVLYVVFFVIPTLQTFQYSVTNWDGYSGEYDVVGLNNFTRAITADALFTNALVNNLKFMGVVVLGQTGISLLLAVLLVKNSRASVALRALFFFPTVLSSVSVGFIWKFVYDPNFGLVNGALDGLGLGSFKSALLGDPAQAIYWLSITQIWFHAGMMIVIFVAGLQAIPKELYEAAEVDGASPWRRFRHITWPLIAPATGIVVAYTIVQSFRAFDVVLSLSGNPPSRWLDILSTRIYASFANSEFGYAATESVLFIMLIFATTFFMRQFLRLVQGGGK